MLFGRMGALSPAETVSAGLQIIHLKSAINDCWRLILDLCRENDRLKNSIPKSLQEAPMDSFVEFVQQYWGKMAADQAAIQMKLRIATIQAWIRWTTDLIVSRLSSGQPAPTTDQIIEEWHKINPPAHVVSTPFGDVLKPVVTGGGTQADLLAELKDLVARYS